MKRVFFTLICIYCFTFYANCQEQKPPSDTIRVVFENQKLIVTEFVSTSGKDVCGRGKHTHSPHLAVFLTDAKARLLSDDGSAKDFDLKAGTTLWSEAETHMVVNNGGRAVKVYLIELK